MAESPLGVGRQPLTEGVHVPSTETEPSQPPTILDLSDEIEDINKQDGGKNCIFIELSKYM